MYLNEPGNLSYYLDQATAIEYPDVATLSLDEVIQAGPPITVIDPDFDNFEDLSLEDCINFALKNTKVFRGYGTPSLQQGQFVSPGQDGLANGPAVAGSIYNVAIRETEPGFLGTPGQISNPGSIPTNTALDANQGVEAALADFDAQFTSSIFWNKTDQPSNSTIVATQQDTVQWQSEFAKKSANGTQFFLRNVNLYTANNLPTIPLGVQSIDSWYRTAYEFEVRQPLLRGRGAFIQRMPIMISRINTDQELANFEALMQNMVTNVEIRYWELYCAYRNLEAAKTGRNAALETWRIIKDQFDEEADVNIQQLTQAAGQYHDFDRQVVTAYNNLLIAEGNLRWLLGWSSTDRRMLRPIDDPVLAPVEFDWCTTHCEAQSYRPELRQERWEIKKRELALAHSRNGLLPELNVTALYRYLGLGNRFGTSGTSDPFPAVSSGALNELYGGNFQEFQLGGEFRMPIGFRRELANVRNAQWKLALEVARLEDMELDVTREMTQAIQALATNQRLMQIAFSQWRTATMEKDHFDELEDAGLATLDVALDAQRRRAESERAFYNAVCEYNKCLALIHRRKGSALAYNGVYLDEGQWPGKAYVDAEEHARRRSASRQLNYGWTRPEVISRGPDGHSGYNVDTVQGGDIYMDEFIDGMPVEQPYYEPTLNNQLNNNTIVPDNSVPTMVDPVSSRKAVDHSDIQQVSYTAPVTRKSPSVMKAQTDSTQPVARVATPRLAESNAKPVNRVPIIQAPAKDPGPPTAKRIPARPDNSSQPSPFQTKISAVTQQNKVAPKKIQRKGLNWEDFGLTNPKSTMPNEVKATIKTSNK